MSKRRRQVFAWCGAVLATYAWQGKLYAQTVEPVIITNTSAASADSDVGGERMFANEPLDSQIFQPSADTGFESSQANPAVRPVQPLGPVTQGSVGPSRFIRTNVVAGPSQEGVPRTRDPDPFEARGFRLGRFQGDAAIEQTAGYSSNVDEQVGGEAGGFTQTDVSLSLTSNWSRHELRSSVFGFWRTPFEGEASDQTFIFGDLGFRYDLREGETITATGFVQSQSQEFTDTLLAPGAVDTPQETEFGASLVWNRDTTRLKTRLGVAIDRELFEDAELGGGATFSQGDRDNTLASVTGRLGYEVSPLFQPFVEGVYGARSFDESIDRNGDRRDSELFEIRGGIAFDGGEKWQGEIAFGYVSERFEEGDLEDLDGFTVNGELIWSPKRDTQVTAQIGTETNDSIIAGENGSLLYEGRLEIRRQVNDRFSTSAFADLEIETNDASNRTLELGVGAQYWINPYLAVTGDLEYESFSSNVPNSDVDSVEGRMGLRLQR